MAITRTKEEAQGRKPAPGGAAKSALAAGRAGAAESALAPPCLSLFDVNAM